MQDHVIVHRQEEKKRNLQLNLSSELNQNREVLKKIEREEKDEIFVFYFFIFSFNIFTF